MIPPRQSSEPRLGRTRHPGIYRDAKSRDGQTLVIVYRHRGRQRKETMRGSARASLKAALARQRQILGEVVTGEHSPRSRLTFDAYVEEWAPSYKGRTGQGIRPHTLADYKRDLELHASPLLGTLRISDIEPPDLRALVARLEKAGKSPNTVRNVIAAVRVVLASAHADGIIRHNPAAGLRLAGAARATVKWLEPEQLGRLFHETPDDWKLFVRLLSYTGCRIGELLALTWADFDRTAKTLAVNKRVYQGRLDAPKSRFGVRTIPLSSALVCALVEHRLATNFSDDACPIFASRQGTRLHPSNISRRIFKPAAARAGVGWASFHTLRHTCATLLARKGLRPEEIQAWLGHHAASFTQDTYIGRPSHLPDVDSLGLDVLGEVPLAGGAAG